MKRNTRPLAALFAAAFLLAAAGVVGAEEIHKIELENRKFIEGSILPVSDCNVLIRTETEWSIVPIDKVRSVDGGRDFAPLLIGGAGPVIRYETFEEVEPNGDMVLHSSFTNRNAGSEVVRSIDWGIAPHEKELLDGWRVFDPFGNELPLRFEERSGGGGRVTADLVRPILPGEEVRFANRIVYHGYTKENQGVWRYVHAGNYPEDRLVQKMVRLPKGARVEMIEPEPVQSFDLDGSPIVVWRRMFDAGEETPLTITYRLGS
ncbi:MAG: hypothetical protein JW958_09010 [Candidatus Eisenbacteria bacterium]|nr:hypothetical protein [Candidatus Eisenbacteria bacterium]